jgi:hypothetical protein
MLFMYPVTCIGREGDDHFDIIGPHFHPWAITIKALQYLERTNWTWQQTPPQTVQ